MRTLIALVLCSSLALAAEDAPVNPHPVGLSTYIQAGEVAPYRGQLIQDAEHARREFNNERTAGELESLKESQGSKFVTLPVLIALVAGSLAVGVAVGVGATLAAKRWPAPG